jgi:PAS domain S-box-containing protein
MKNQKTILIVEDDPIIMMVEKSALEKYGYDIFTADTGEESIEIIKNNPIIELVLMDIDLGDGIDGTQAAEIILKEREIPIVFLSSHTEPEVVSKTEKITSYGYVVKNSSITVLDASIKMAFKLFDANQKLKATKDKLEATLDALPDVLFEVGLNGCYYDFHSSRTELIFRPVTEILGQSIYTILPTNVADIVMNAIKEANEKGVSIGGQFEMIVPAGNLWFEISVTRKGNELIDPHFIILKRDITLRKKTMESLQESEERNRILLDSINDAILIYYLNPEGMPENFIEVNNVACEIMGYTKNEFLKLSPMDIVKSPNGENFSIIMKSFIEDKELLIEWIHISKTGKEIPVEVSSHLFDLKGKQTVISVARDITDRKKKEIELLIAKEKAEISESTLRVNQVELQMQNEELHNKLEELDILQQKYFDMYHLASVGYLTINADGLILEANLTTSKLLGIVLSKLINQPFSKYIHEEDRDNYYHFCKQILESVSTDSTYNESIISGHIGSQMSSRLRMVHSDGLIFPAYLVAVLTHDSSTKSEQTIEEPALIFHIAIMKDCG